MIGSMLSATRYERILRLLDQEHRVLLNGPLSSLGPLVERREALIAELFDGTPDLPEGFLAAIKSRAERNSRLILASIAGVKSGEAQLARIAETHDRLRTYSAEGEALDVGPTRTTRDVRA